MSERSNSILSSLSRCRAWTKDSVWYLDAILDQLAVDMVSGTEMDVKGVVLLQILVLAKERAEHVVSVTEEPLDLTALKAAACFCAFMRYSPAIRYGRSRKAVAARESAFVKSTAARRRRIRPGKKLIL